jgi:hypothetical protein
VLYYEASGSKYFLHAVFMDLEPGVIGAVALSYRFASSSEGNPREPKRGAGNKWAKAHYKRPGHDYAESPCCVAAFVVN